MNGWYLIARKIVRDNSDADALVQAIATALENAATKPMPKLPDGDRLDDIGRLAERVTALEERLAGGTRPVLVNDQWLEHLNNKLAQIHQRMNELDGRQRGLGDIVTKQDARLTVLDDWAKETTSVLKVWRPRLDKLQEIAFKVQAEWTTEKVDQWAKENLDPNPPKVQP